MLPIAPPTIMPNAMRTMSDFAAASRKRTPEEPEHDQRHADQQDRVAAEQAERAVHVAFVRPPQQVGDDDPALAGKKRSEHQVLGVLIEPQYDDRDERDHQSVDEFRGSVAGQTDRTILRREECIVDEHQSDDD